MDKLKLESKDIITNNIEKIRELFPNVVTEGENGLGIDFNLLKQELISNVIEPNQERYQLSWPGKHEAIHSANVRTKRTLRPIKQKSLNFDNTKNVYIEGDNLEALKILQESYLGKIKFIYIDPPYNTGKDFIYKDNFRVSATEELGKELIIDELGNKRETNSESNGRYHSNWLSMMYPRLKLSRNLLTNDGAIFISIDNNEYANLKKICDEIFGESNFCGSITRKQSAGAKNDTGSNKIVSNADYVLVYSKTSDFEFNYIEIENDTKKYNKIDDIGSYKARALEMQGGDDTLEKRPKMGYSIYFDGRNVEILFDYDVENEPNYLEPNEALVRKGYKCYRPRMVGQKHGRWRWGAETFLTNFAENNVLFENDRVYLKQRIKDKIFKFPVMIEDDFLNTKGTNEVKKLFSWKAFDFPKPVELIETLLEYGSDKDSIILDFFSGSATTAHAVMNLNASDLGNRKYICIQIPESTSENSNAVEAGYSTICEIGQERIRRASKKIMEETSVKIDNGFRVYKIDESNMKEIYYKPNNVSQSLLDFLESNIKEDRNNLDLLTQVILDLGLTLDLEINEININHNLIFDVDNGNLLACFDDKISLETIEIMAKNTNEYDISPEKIVVKESAFSGDRDLINASEKIKNISRDIKFVIL